MFSKVHKFEIFYLGKSNTSIFGLFRPKYWVFFFYLSKSIGKIYLSENTTEIEFSRMRITLNFFTSPEYNKSNEVNIKQVQSAS